MNTEKEVNFKVKGNIEYEISYEGDNLKITVQENDANALVHLFQANQVMQRTKHNMQSDKFRKNFSVKDRKDIVSTCWTLGQMITAFGKKVYENMLMAKHEEEKEQKKVIIETKID